MKKTMSGFTIVELLVVIVVIGILAAVIVVGYRGIRERAVTAQYASAADTWEKLIKLQFAEMNSLPVTSGYVCLGKSASDYPATDGYAAGACTASGSITWNQATIDAFSPFVQKNFPSAKSLPPVSSGARGLVYFAPLPNYATMAWWVPSKNGCGRAVDDWAIDPTYGNYAQCHIYFDFR